MTTTRVSARTLWKLLEPIHAVTYFSAEPLAALKAAGYRGFWMGYMAGRSAPLGRASAELVHALFYNFDFKRVAGALPDAWSFAAPEAALDARLTGSVAALERLIDESVPAETIKTAADLATMAAVNAPMEGRPLYAANRALPIPEEPLARLWHAATLLREHRGDGHVAALLNAGIAGRASHILQAASSGTPKAVYEVARDFTDAEWSAEVDALRSRGLIRHDGALTADGASVKADLEAHTDALAETAYAVLTESQLDDLTEALRPITRAVVAGGDIPIASPMGLNLEEALAM
ncbi:MAG TPA: hypothetical protein VGS21_01225 [Acidimicrobiales bacterium]|nr:hypothetical protein [Acidimicrobiales bacterium]